MPEIFNYITRAEYECHHCHALPLDLYTSSGQIAEPYYTLFKGFRFIRREWGHPIIINSGFRCAEHNKAIGGKPMSIHLFGLALDIKPTGGSLGDLIQLIEQWRPKFRRGRYPTFTHIDVGYLIKPRALVEWHEGARW